VLVAACLNGMTDSPALVTPAPFADVEGRPARRMKTLRERALAGISTVLTAAGVGSAGAAYVVTAVERSLTVIGFSAAVAAAVLIVAGVTIKAVTARAERPDHVAPVGATAPTHNVAVTLLGVFLITWSIATLAAVEATVLLGVAYVVGL
jgi:hypothetical protein